MPLWGWFTLLFGISFLPWLLSLAMDATPSSPDDDKVLDLGLMIIDTTLTIASCVFLVMWLGWWSALFIGLMIGLSFVLRGLGLTAYGSLKRNAFF